jgi:hypothetical protein
MRVRCHIVLCLEGSRAMANVLRFSICVVAVWAVAGQVWAAPKSFTIINRSGEMIVSIVAQAIGDSTADAVFTATTSIANGDTLDISVELPDEACLVDITYTLASSKPFIQNNIDVCSADAIIVE